MGRERLVHFQSGGLFPSARPTRERILKVRKKERISTGTVYDAHIGYGYTLKEIAKAMGVHYTTVSRMVKAAEDE